VLAASMTTGASPPRRGDGPLEFTGGDVESPDNTAVLPVRPGCCKQLAAVGLPGEVVDDSPDTAHDRGLASSTVAYPNRSLV